MNFKVCMGCGEETAHERVAPLAVTHAGKSENIEDRQTYCGQCKNISYVGEQVSQHELAVAAAIRRMDGLLSAEELRLIRSKYRLKQTDLEKMLDTGAKTWTRWERGKVPQSKTADKLIRVIAEDPEIARRLMLEAGVKNAEAEAVFARIDEDAKILARIAVRWEVGSVLGQGNVNQRSQHFADRLADRAYETARDVRRQAAAQVEAA